MAQEDKETEQKNLINAEYRELYSNRVDAMKSVQSIMDPMLKVSQNIPYHQIEYMHDVNLKVVVEFGRSKMTLGEVLSLKKSSIIKVDKSIGEPVDVLAGETLIARGEIVIVNDRLGIRLTEIVRPVRRTQITSDSSEGVKNRPSASQYHSPTTEPDKSDKLDNAASNKVPPMSSDKPA